MSFIAPQAKLFDHMDTLQDMKVTGRSRAPINAEIDLSNRCSLGCEWCHFAYTHSRGPLKGAAKPADAVPGGDLMETSLALDIIRQLAETGVESVTWTGGGEPTLHPQFDDIVDYAGGKLAQGIYTNGCHITPERAELLKRLFTFVYVSLDAADARSYKRAKGVDRFGAACDGIRLLAEAEGEATVGVGYLVTPDNYKQISDAAFLAERLGADYLQLRPTVRYDITKPGVPAENTVWITAALDVIGKAAYYHPNIEVDFSRFKGYRDWTGHGYDTCWWATLQTVITPNGLVWRCVNKREHPAALLGDLTQESFQKIWARATAVPVDNDCRVSCRGHLANQALTEILAPRLHPEFV